MRRHAPFTSRQSSFSKSAVISGSILLLLLLIFALATRLTRSSGPLTYPVEAELFQEYQQASSTPHQQRNSTSLDVAASVLDLADRLPLTSLQQAPALSPKLQPNVLSTFTSYPAPAAVSDNADLTAFVQGYQQLEPVLSVTSFIPLSLKPSRGIILPAGKVLRLGSAYVTLQLLRDKLNCKLPVEIWHVPGEIDEHTKTVFEVCYTLAKSGPGLSTFPFLMHAVQSGILWFGPHDG